MEIIKCLVAMVDDELEGAENYVKAANKYRITNKPTADAMIKLAEVELTHVKALHDELVRIIDEYRAKNGAPPDSMMSIYAYEHEKHIEREARIKVMISSYKA